jgi:chemotaxis protein CheY-P-specific phosphatase CheC
MSERILKLLGTEITMSANTATTVSSAQLLRILPRSNTVITVKDGSTITGSASLDANQVFFLRKKATETVESTAAGTLAVAVGFGD